MLGNLGLSQMERDEFYSCVAFVKITGLPIKDAEVLLKSLYQSLSESQSYSRIGLSDRHRLSFCFSGLQENILIFGFKDEGAARELCKQAQTRSIEV